jgi:hypothetical protein
VSTRNPTKRRSALPANAAEAHLTVVPDGDTPDDAGTTLDRRSATTPGTGRVVPQKRESPVKPADQLQDATPLPVAKPKGFLVEMPPSMHTHLKIVAAERATTMHAIALEALSKELGFDFPTATSRDLSTS